MRRIAAAVLLALAAFVGPTAAAQDTDVPPAVPSPAVVQEEGDDSDARPWGRLLIFVPLSALIGAAAVVGRRAARERGWTQS